MRRPASAGRRIAVHGYPSGVNAAADVPTVLPRSRWIAARARNLVHRGGLLVSVGAAMFALSFGLLLWFTRAEREALRRVPAAADTLDLARAVGSLRRQQSRADSTLAGIPIPRRYAVRAAAIVVVSTGDSVRRDSLATPLTNDEEPLVVDTVRTTSQLPDALRIAAAALSAKLERAQNAPLASSWRALAADPMLQQDARVRALADSLADAERARNEYDAVGGVDPIYLELSSRVTAYGRAIERAAVVRLASLTRAAAGGPELAVVARAGPGPAELDRRFAEDSARYVAVRARRATAVRAADSVTSMLAARRAEAVQRDAARLRAQHRVDALAPPIAMVMASAAAAVGLSLLLALMLELRAPRVADDGEVVTQARVPLLLSIRASDASTTDSLTSAFSQLAFDLEPLLTGSNTLVVVSDDAGLAARTAARIAERLGYDGRRVRVVSPRQGTARSTTRRRNRITPTATRSVLVHPERTQGVAWTGEYFLEAVHDDTITVRSGNLGDVRAALGTADHRMKVMLVVRIGSTPTAWLARIRTAVLSAASAEAIGVVAWAPGIDDGDPVQFALDSALQRALDTAPAAGR